MTSDTPDDGGDDRDGWITLPIDRWLEPFTLRAPTVTAACWSDLLGFGSQLDQAGWNLMAPASQPLINRLGEFAARLRSSTLPNEETLFVNDGAIRTFSPALFAQGENNRFNLVWWLHSCLTFHARQVHFELERNLPGIRSVVCEGHIAPVNPLSLRYATLPPGTRFMRPLSAQLNTALSKCYMVDHAGSNSGLRKGGVYVEELLLQRLIADYGCKIYDDEMLFLNGICLLQPAALYRGQTELFHLRESNWRELGLADDRSSWLALGSRVTVPARSLTIAVREVLAYSPIDEFVMFWIDLFSGSAHGYLIDGPLGPDEGLLEPTSKDFPKGHEALAALLQRFKDTSGPGRESP